MVEGVHAQTAAPPPAPGTAAAAQVLSFPPTLPGVRDPKAPLLFEADELGGEAGIRTTAKGRVRLRQSDLTVRADELEHTQADNTARARGNVRIIRQGSIFTGPSMSLKLDTLEGSFEAPRYWLSRTQAGGSAERITFQGEDRLSATNTSYTSCTPENTASGDMGTPAWALRTDRIDLDFAANEGRAEGAVIEFQGIPILAAPSLTFPLNDQRKSGWLPPSFTFDSKSGLELSAPYYWNIAPERDATLAPTLATRRGLGLDAEYRYLAPQDKGEVRVFGLPDDRVAGRNRGQVDLRHEGQAGSASSLSPTRYTIQWLRVSDDDYWKDFGQTISSKTPRLLDSHVRVNRTLNERNWGLGNSQTELYAQLQTWQTLRDLDTSAPPESRVGEPYRREPQLGVRSRGTSDNGLVWSLQGEFNRFAHPDRSWVSGNRVHAIGQVERRFDFHGVYVQPKLMLQSTSYDLDRGGLNTGPRSATRTLPTFSLDSGFTLDRPVQLFGRDLVQTLEPRLLYVRTPYKDQSNLPMFDTAPRDFNQYAIYSENGFTGVDRISDANQVTLGVTSRLLDDRTGAEALRVGIVQKLLLSDQRINPNGSGPITSRFSDLMLLGSTTVIPHWYLDSTLQYNTEEGRSEQGTLGVRYTPGDWRTVSTVYRYTRGGSSQVELGWQWPIAGRPRTATASQLIAQSPLAVEGSGMRAPGSCGGAWYSVGRLAYSTRESRFINALMGLEYDAGCWIGRFVAERVAIGQNEATVRLMFQLELVGLSRLSLGANPLRTLKDNIPGYRLLREEGEVVPTGPSPLYDPDD
jgi:LPS-assembly protein